MQVNENGYFRFKLRHPERSEGPPIGKVWDPLRI